MNFFITVALICSLEQIFAIVNNRDERGGRQFQEGPGRGRGGSSGGRGGAAKSSGGPPPGGTHGRHGGYRGPHGSPPNIYQMFPACKTLSDSMRAKQCELKISGEIGPENCQGGDYKVCMQRDMEKVRCAITEDPEKDCIDEILAFVQGDICEEEREEVVCDSCDPEWSEDSPQQR